MANVFFETHGCSANFSESEAMMGILRKNKAEIVSNPGDADVIVLNLCTVKGENTALKAIKKAERHCHEYINAHTPF